MQRLLEATAQRAASQQHQQHQQHQDRRSLAFVYIFPRARVWPIWEVWWRGAYVYKIL